MSERLRQIVLFNVPKDLPCYGDWNFKVFAGQFALFVDVLQTDLSNHIRRDRSLILWLLSPRHRGYRKSHRQLQKILAEESIGFDAITPEQHHTIWVIARERIYSRSFAYYFCPECQRRYPPEEGNVLEWSFGIDLCAHGGRRFECPQGHTLYSIMDWET